MFRYQKGMVTIVSVMLFLFMSSSCAFTGDKTFKGRVIDVDTKEPIEGAVVVAHWDEARGGIAGEDTRLKDVKETLTGKNGEWSIIGPEGREAKDSVLLLTFLTGTYYTRHPSFIVFKPGYCPWPKGFSIIACKEKLRPEGSAKIAEGEMVELAKLTDKKIRFFAIPNPDYGTDLNKKKNFLRRQRNFLRLINVERKEIGLSEIQMFKEIENE